MSGAGGLDIRIPIGGLFSTLGLLLGGYGLATLGQADRYAISAGININLWWGLAMLVFGLVLLKVATSARASRSVLPPPNQRKDRRQTNVSIRAGLER